MNRKGKGGRQRMSIQFTVPLAKIISAMKLEVAYMPASESEVLISSADINRPGLQLAGFFDYFVVFR